MKALIENYTSSSIKACFRVAINGLLKIAEFYSDLAYKVFVYREQLYG